MGRRCRAVRARIRREVLLLCISWGAVALFAALSAGSAESVLKWFRIADTRPEPTPGAFGSFHFLWIFICAISVILAILAAWRLPFSNSDRRKQTTVDRTVFAFGILFLMLELYKQFFFWFILNGKRYDVSIFPFQFCSLPIYFCLLAPLLPSAAFRNGCYRFLALYGTVGGYLVIGFPNLPDVMVLCYHTMIWHTLMISLGAFLLVATNCGEKLWRDILPGTVLFLLFFWIAMLFNRVLIPLEASGGKLNLYYMSPRYPTTYFVIRTVRAKLGWGASAVCYQLLFIFVGALPLWLLGRIFCFFRKKGENRSEMTDWKKVFWKK